MNKYFSFILYLSVWLAAATQVFSQASYIDDAVSPKAVEGVVYKVEIPKKAKKFTESELRSVCEQKGYKVISVKTKEEEVWGTLDKKQVVTYFEFEKSTISQSEVVQSPKEEVQKQENETEKTKTTSTYKGARPEFADNSPVKSTDPLRQRIWHTNDGKRSKEWRTPLELGGNYSNSTLYAIDMVNDKVGYIVGEEGLIMKTTDGGESWKGLNSGVFENLFCVDFIDENNGWVSGQDGTIMHTTNGGESWSIQNENQIKYSFICLKFINLKKGFAGGGLDGQLNYTEDGGNTWNKQPLPIGSSVSAIYFYNENIGWMVVRIGASNMPSCSLLKTTDGGKTWEVLTSHASLINKFFFLDENEGYFITTNSVVLRTTNGGRNLDIAHKTYFTRSPLTSISRTADGLLWVTSDVGDIFMSSDKGTTWKPTSKTYEEKSTEYYDKHLGKGEYLGLHPPIDKYSLYSNFSFSNGKLLAIGERGTILKSNDKGLSWKNSTVGLLSNCMAISLVDEKNGWALSEKGEILNTKDGGFKWDTTNIEENFLKTKNKYYDIFFLNSNNGWIVGDYGLILNTTNGGETWTSQKLTSKNFLKKIFFIDESMGWIVGSQGTFFRTTDGGKTWNYVQLPINIFMSDVTFLNQNEGWIVGDNYNIISVTEGGAKSNVQQQAQQIIGSLTSVYFLDKKNGWVSSSSGLIFKTVNGGATWTKVSPKIIGLHDKGKSINDVYFRNANEGWAVGISGNILFTDDGGSTWNTLNKATNLELFRIAFHGNTGLIVGENGTILKLKN
jgi:photosystem II stability/assembly factor-like uncharacterized protein